MANRLGVSSAFYQKLKTEERNHRKIGKKKQQIYIISMLNQAAELDECMFEALNSQSMDVTGFSADDRNMLLSFARKLGTMDDSKKNQFRKLMDK